MSRGIGLGTERIDRHDSDTGLLVRQITSFPSISLHLHYETPTFTPDGERMLIMCMRGAYRGAPYDLVTVGSDGRDMVRLSSSDDPDGASSSCMTVDGKDALYMESGTCHRTNLADLTHDELGHVDGARHHNYYRGARSYDGRYYFSTVGLGARLAVVRWDLQSGEHTIVERLDRLTHPKANPGGPEFQYGARFQQEDGTMKSESRCIHCETLKPMELTFPQGEFQTAHTCWLGETGRYCGTLKMPGRGVVVMDRDTDDPDQIAEGPYFWHCGASRDGKWIVADSSWPDEGLWLINVATRKRERLCFSGSSQGHPQYTHPHANLSDDGGIAVFTSDATGVTQVYVVYVPDEMRERLASPSSD